MSVKFIKIAFSLLFMSVLVLLLTVIWFRLTLPEPLFDASYATIIESSEGELLSARIADDEQWRFPASDSLPSYFVKSLLTFEDRYFFRHPGVNPVSILRAANQNRRAGRIVSGGSTITMQVVRLSRGNPPRTIPEKIKEIFAAIALEWKYSKDEILKLYAAHAPFGGNVVGLEAASWRYFGRPPYLLTLAESAALAVLPNSPALIFPGRNQELLGEKRNRLLKRLYDLNEIDELTYKLAAAESLPGQPHRLPDNAPHLVNRFIADGGKGKRLHSTLNTQLQQRAINVIGEHRTRLQANQIHHLAGLIAEVKTGRILAYIGNSGDMRRRGSQVDMITARRSPGSTLKPLLYFLQLNSGQLLPHSLVADVPTRIGGYAPRNFDLAYDGAVPASEALSRSLNVPAVRNLQDYGVPVFHHNLQQMGITTLTRPPEHYGLSLILGGSEVTMWDMAGVFASMAVTLNSYDPINRDSRFWRQADLHYEASHQPTPAVNRDFPVHPSAIWETFNVMQEVRRPESEVNWREFVSGRRIAWKTGTSYGSRDGWAIGLTPEHVIVVWAGNADGEGRPGLTGIGAAAPAMFGLLNLLDDGGWFRQPVFDMEYAEICLRSGYRAGQNCETTDFQLIPAAGLNSGSCPYHHRVHTDESGIYRVNSDCYPVSQMRTESWFVLPPVQEWYYRTKNTYRAMPEWLDGCEPDEARPSLALIYPDESPSIYIPVELDGSTGRTVFEAAHRVPGTRIWWHLDDIYLGETRTIHQVSLAPKPGNYLLTLVDEHGERLQRRVRIIK